MPTDQIDSFRVICEGGLNTNESTLILSQDQPGSATALVNYESAISGGYRRVSGFQPWDADFAEVAPGVGAGKVLWGSIFNNTVTGVNEVIAARADIGNVEYHFYKLDPVLGWQQITTATRLMSGAYSTVNKLRATEFNFGSDNQIIFVDGVNPAIWYDGTTWTTITSTGVGTVLDPGGDQVIDAPSLICTFKGHVFLSGDLTPDGRARVVHSAPLQPATWTAAAGAGQVFPGYDVVQIRPFRDELFVFGKTAIKKALADLAAGFVLQDVTDDLGCLAADSVLEVGGNLIFFSQDGVRPVAGTDKLNDVELGLLSQNIQPIIDEMLGSADFTSLNGVVIRAKTQFRYTWGSDAIAVENAPGIIGSVRQNKKSGRQWEWGELTGIRTSTMWSGLINDREIVLHGDYDGCLYRQEQGSSFNGAYIVSVYSTPFLDIGATDIRKLMREINTFINAEGSATMFIGLKFDWDLASTLTPANYTGLVTSGSSYYDSLSSIYDSPTTTYGADNRTIMNTKLQGSCFSVKFNFINASTDQPFTIQGFIPEYSVKGRN